MRCLLLAWSLVHGAAYAAPDAVPNTDCKPLNKAGFRTIAVMMKSRDPAEWKGSLELLKRTVQERGSACLASGGTSLEAHLGKMERALDAFAATEQHRANAIAASSSIAQLAPSLSILLDELARLSLESKSADNTYVATRLLAFATRVEKSVSLIPLGGIEALVQVDRTTRDLSMIRRTLEAFQSGNPELDINALTMKDAPERLQKALEVLAAMDRAHEVLIKNSAAIEDADQQLADLRFEGEQAHSQVGSHSRSMPKRSCTFAMT